MSNHRTFRVFPHISGMLGCQDSGTRISRSGVRAAGSSANPRAVQKHFHDERVVGFTQYRGK